ncbi:hypothetical protein [Bernardetia sp.]|uniref:hypothetical protein n=1 Tax=Bernardetia sp. TaxID=1937974 RepID=UPI0025B850AA|nr:hypothetical protein [Bernardetia sp.]
MSIFSNRPVSPLLSVFSILFLVFTHISCIPPDVKGTADTQFFDLKGFLEYHIEKLEKQKVSVAKKTILQGIKTEQTLKKINWKDEFAYFYASDINTPQLRDRYQINKTPTQWSFKTESENLIVRQMEIYFESQNDDSFQNVKEIMIVQKDKNVLYENNRALRFKVKNGLLEAYTIIGSENVILNDAQVFQVEGIVIP